MVFDEIAMVCGMGSCKKSLDEPLRRCQQLFRGTSVILSGTTNCSVSDSDVCPDCCHSRPSIVQYLADSVDQSKGSLCHTANCQSKRCLLPTANSYSVVSAASLPILPSPLMPVVAHTKKGHHRAEPLSITFAPQTQAFTVIQSISLQI